MVSDADIIRQRVHAAFRPEVADDFVLQFLAELRVNLRDAEKAIRPATGVNVGLAGARVVTEGPHGGGPWRRQDRQ